MSKRKPTEATERRLREATVKAGLETLDWEILQSHLDEIAVTKSQVSELCGHIRRHTDFICKYPRKEYEKRRDGFFEHAISYVRGRLGQRPASQIASEVQLIKLIERGYRSIVATLARCDIGRRSPEIRVSACIDRACYEYGNLRKLHDKAVAEAAELNLMSGLRLTDDNGRPYSPDAALDALAESVAMTVVMESYTNGWFVKDVVVLPDLPPVGQTERYQSGSTQMLALCWRQWHRVEKRRRFLGGKLTLLPREKLPQDCHPKIDAVITYEPEAKGLSENEVYDFLANKRLQDRLVQTFFEMELEAGLSGGGIGIGDKVDLPPAQIVSIEEAHAGMSLSELLGYSIADDSERPCGIRLLEWVRGYIVLKEVARTRAAAASSSGESYAIRFGRAELIDLLQRCGLAENAAARFIELVALHKSARDMFDCPLIRIGQAEYLLFAPAVIDLNVAMAVLSNLSNRGAELGSKGLAFEGGVQRFFKERRMPVFAFRARRANEEFEYDAVLAWDRYLFLFECKNRSLSGGDPAQAYYFDLEVKSQAKQALRLARALEDFPDIIEEHLGKQYLGMTIVPCVLHSLPYSRIGKLGGVYFTDWSALTRFFSQPYFRIKVPHRIGNKVLLHRTAMRRLWEGDVPTAKDFLKQIEEPFQLSLSLQHLDISLTDFIISESEVVVTSDIFRAEMTTRSISNAVGVDADRVLKEIAEVGEYAKAFRSKLDARNNKERKDGEKAK